MSHITVGLVGNGISCGRGSLFVEIDFSSALKFLMNMSQSALGCCPTLSESEQIINPIDSSTPYNSFLPEPERKNNRFGVIGYFHSVSGYKLY